RHTPPVGTRSPYGLLLSQEGRKRRQTLNVIGQDFEGGQEGDRQEGTRDSPEQPPEQHADQHRYGTELEALAVDERAHQVILQRRDNQIHSGDQEKVPQGIELAEGGRGQQDNHASRAQIGYELEQYRQ